jgi:hypothetical protein
MVVETTADGGYPDSELPERPGCIGLGNPSGRGAAQPRIGRIEVIGSVGMVMTRPGSDVDVVEGAVVVVVVGGTVVVVVGGSVVVVSGGLVGVVVSGGGGGSVVRVTCVVVVVEPGGRGCFGGLVVGVVELEVVGRGDVVVVIGGTNGSEMVKGAVWTVGLVVLARFFLVVTVDEVTGLGVVDVVDGGGTSTGSCTVAVVVVVPAAVPLVVDLCEEFTAARPPTKGAGPCRWDTK